MFKKKEATKSGASSAQNITVINKGTVVEGEIQVQGTIRIYGQLNGTVRSEGRVIVAEDGTLSGDLYAAAAEVSGTVEGVIEADRLDLRSTATVEGNVVVKTFTTETGAIFVGDCKMPQNGVLPSGDGAATDAPAETSPAKDAHAGDGAAADESEGDASSAEAPQEGESEPEEAGDASSAEEQPAADPEPVPVASASKGASVEGGVKPLPNKPSTPPNVEAQPVEEGAPAAESDEDAAEDQGGRPRFW